MEVSKRAAAADYEVSNMIEEDSATVHGVVVDLSPIKSSRNNPAVKYFNARISDGKKSARVVSFEPKLRPSLETSQMEGSTVAIVNCRIKPGKFDSALEVTASHHTEVATSPKKFKLDLSLQGSMKPVPLDELQSLSANQHVCVTGKVTRIGDTTEVTSKNKGKPLLKQDCSLKDSKGSIRIVLWENDIGKLQDDTSYKLDNV